MSEDSWRLKEDGRAKFIALFLGLRDDLNHSELFIEAIDSIPTEVVLNGYNKRFSTYYPDNIEKVMKHEARQRGTEVELPSAYDNWDDYKWAMGQTLSGINELSEDETFKRIASGHQYQRYYGTEFGEEDLKQIERELEEFRKSVVLSV